MRETESDVSLLRNYLTKDLIEDLDLYLYAKEDDEWVIVEKDWEKVRDGIVASMTNFGYPTSPSRTPTSTATASCCSSIISSATSLT